MGKNSVWGLRSLSSYFSKDCGLRVMGAGGYEHSKCCPGRDVVVSSTLDIPARTVTLAVLEGSFAVTPQGTLSPQCKLHAPHLQLAAHTTSHVSPIARRTPAPVRSGTWPGYQEWCEAVNGLDCLWYMMWGGRRLDGGKGCEDYWAFHFQFPDSPLWQRRWAWL